MKVLTNEELKDLDLTKILKIDDEVWDIRFGKGIVIEICRTDLYSIKVVYDYIGKLSYTKDGKHEDLIYILLFIFTKYLFLNIKYL